MDQRQLSSVPPQVRRPVPPVDAQSPALARLAAGVPSGRADVAGFWSDVGRRGTPIVEPIAGHPGHRAVTFLWRGGDELREVLVIVNKLTDAFTIERSRMHRLPGTDVWHRTYRMGASWRASYAIAPIGDTLASPALSVGEQTLLEERRARALAASPAPARAALEAWFDALHHVRPDPRAREQLDRQWSVVSLPDTRRQPWAAHRSGVQRCAVHRSRIRSTNLGTTRQVSFTVPPDDPPEGGWPLVVLLDGQEWDGARAMDTFDNLLADGVVMPFAAVMPWSPDMETRVEELTCNPRFVRFLTEELLTWADDQLGSAGTGALTTDPMRTVIVGQSLGGLSAVFARHLAPQRFGHAVAQSGSFWWPNPAGGGQAEWLTAQLAEDDARPGTTYLSVGTQEWVSLEPTRRLRDVLSARGDEIVYREFDGGHDRACWRGDLADALVTVMKSWRE